ncbi:MAG TPA: hypothetical protein VMK16_05095 [Acidimicrobiales bacterium]|nr:hypothetical protein [Acidimicrobiales bacterium]
MSTRLCPACGAQYLGWVTRCADCGVALVDAGPSVLDLPEDDQLVYELGEWSMDRRSLLESLLGADGIGHAWEAADLVVHVDDEARVDALVEAIEQGGVVGAATSEQAGLEGDQLVYELDEWSPTDRHKLGEQLTAAGVPFVWDAADALVVAADDEDAVEVILDSIEYPDALEEVVDESGDDDEAAQQALSELFLASDRLMHDPEDEDGTNGLLKAVEIAREVGVPYGIAPATWKAVVEHANELREGLMASPDEEVVDQIVERATALRSLLRPYV